MLGFRDLIKPAVAELARRGVGSDAIYRNIRESFGVGFSRQLIRAEAYWRRPETYKERYFGVRRLIATPESAFKVRPRDTKQQERYFWQGEINGVNASTGAPMRKVVAFTSDINRPESEIRKELVAKSERLYGLVKAEVSIEDAWRKL